MDAEHFAITANHLILLRRMNIGWGGCEYGAPCVDPKRPYGNGDVVGDMARLLNVPTVPTDDEETHWPPGTSDKMRQLHLQTQTALDIVLSTGSFVVGNYTREAYGQPWILAGKDDDGR